MEPIIQKIIADINGSGSERYRYNVIHAVKGPIAFDLHTQMVSLKEEWLDSFSENDKKKSLLVAAIQQTYSKATLKNPEKAPIVPRRRLWLFFYNATHTGPVRTSIPYSQGKKWLKAFKDSGADLII